ncbi:MAG: class II aldolase/adducin family protein [Thermovirgaceae bacterium]
MDDREMREGIVHFGRKMLEAGLTRCTGGNLSCRGEDGRIAVSPSGMNYDKTTPEDVVILSETGEILSGDKKPSSEVPLHLELYKRRPETGAVVHTHSLHVSVLACLGWEIPPFHYLMASFGGKILIAPYAHFGSRELALSVAATIGEGKAVILANHGLVTVGEDLEKAFEAAETAEFLAEIYLKARSAGKPRCLGEDQVDRLKKLFENYERNRSMRGKSGL